MPYFTRQPYAAPSAPSETVTAEPDIMQLAEKVLAESAPSPDRVLQARHPVRGGETARIKLQFASDGGTLALRFAMDEMTGPGGTIPAAACAIEPPATVIRADTSAVVTVTVAVPPQTAPGPYTGRLRVTGDERFDEVLSVMVMA